MAKMSDGGGGNMFAGVGQAFNNISNTAKKVGSSTNKKKKTSSTGSGVGRSIGSVSNAARNIGRATGNSARNRNSSRSSNRGSGYNSRNTGGGYVSPPRPATGSTAGGTVVSTSPPPAVPPARLTDDQILAKDTTWQGQQASYLKALQDFQANNTAERNKYTGQYDATKKSYDTQKANDWTSLQDDYASRGLSTSGLFADATSDFNNDWATKYADLDRAKTAYYGDLDTALKNFQGDQAESKKNAQQQAIQRYLDSLKG